MQRLLLFILLAALGAGCTRGSGDEALSITEQQRRTVDPQVARLLYDGQQAFQREAYSRALALTDSAARYAPDLADVHFLRGRSLSKLYRLDQAKAAFHTVLALDPAYRGAWFNLGHNAFVLGQNREALAYYQHEQDGLAPAARRGSPEEKAMFSAVAAQVGRVYARLGVPDSARMAYRQALDADSTNAQAYGWLGELYQEEGDHEQALRYAQRAFDLAPRNLEYHYLMGALLFRLGKADEAVGYLKTVVAQQPWHVGAHYNLGRALVALGREDEAQPYLDETEGLQTLQSDLVRTQFAVYQNPEDHEAWRLLVDLLGRAGRIDEARQAALVARSLAGPQ